MLVTIVTLSQCDFLYLEGDESNLKSAFDLLKRSYHRLPVEYGCVCAGVYGSRRGELIWTRLDLSPTVWGFLIPGTLFFPPADSNAACMSAKLRTLASPSLPDMNSAYFVISLSHNGTLLAVKCVTRSFLGHSKKTKPKTVGAGVGVGRKMVNCTNIISI